LFYFYGSNLSATNIYTCTIGDNTILSQSPCGETDIQIKVEETQSYKPNNQHSKDNSSHSSNNTKSFINQKKVSRTIKKIESLTIRMNKELNVLKNKPMQASNNRAGAIYKNAISNEMISTTNKYKNLIDTQKLKLKALQNKMK
jgi:hypothetical protein